MPRDFKSFAKENKKIFNDSKINFDQSKTQDYQAQADSYQEILNKYKNMDNNELMSNLFSEASKLKKEGKLDANTLSSLKTTITPFLNAEQQEMLNSLIKAINEQA